MRHFVVEPLTPEEERERIAALRRYQVLDTPPEECFDRITRLASRVFGTPIALVSLIDTDRQWFKSRVGLETRETPRDQAICAYAILGDEPFVINDTHQDARFRDGPLIVGDPRIRFYGGAPLFTPDRKRIGTLCVIDQQPREMSADERDMLVDFASIVVDELEFRHAAIELKGGLQQLELIEDIGDIGHWRLDAHGDVHCSAHVQKLLGQEEGRPVLTLDEFLSHVSRKGRDTVREALKSLREDERFRSRVKVANSARAAEIVGRRQGAEVIGVFQDVSEQESLLRRVRQSEKMATVGTLVAGIAHEINNPLSCIKANADVLGEELENLDGGESPQITELQELTEDIRDGSQRIHRIVQGLQTFSRSTESRQQVVELERVLRVAGRLCTNEVRHKASLAFEIHDAPLAWGEESQLVQVAVNLLTNAAHAIQPSAANSNQIVARCGMFGEDSVFFEVEDSGSGMSEMVADRAFDPFFTTKAQGMGTGLGLSISHGIVLAMGGTIAIQSTEGEGTTLRVELPRASRISNVEVAVDESEACVDTGRPARVLVIDDEPAVGRAMSRILRRYTVSVEVDAQQALARLKQGENVDAILCDLMMPSMTGADFFAELQVVRPDLVRRTAFVTGGAFTKEGRGFFESVRVPVLTKPVELNELRALVAALVRAD
ncbi:MAG: ATP-binding protein [Polyangiales bacterium]